LEILDNLLGNADRYTPQNTQMWVEARRAGRTAVLAVEDAGPGVPATERERIFEQFTRLDNGPLREPRGLGLGLTIARQLARAQGGELNAVDPTRRGTGARFELRLPLAPSRRARAGITGAVLPLSR
jgi:signal transduction histidine kinase